MTLLGGWVLAPLALALLVLGHGLALERVAGVRLPVGVLAGAGLGALVALAGLLTILDATAELAVPVCAAAAVAGLALGRGRLQRRPGPETLAALGVAAGAYALFAAPSLLSGQASVAGYIKLDDSPTWLALTAHVLEHGRQLEGLVPSSFTRSVQEWLGTDYPVGAFLPLGISARLAGVDPLAAYQATIAACAAILGLGLFAAARGLAGSPRRAAAAALVGVQASLFLGYAQWGGIKEAVTAALLPPLAALALHARREPRVLVAAAMVAGALLGVLGPNGAAWVAPALALGAAVAVGPAGLRRSLVAPAAAAAAVGLVSALPALSSLDFARHTTVGVISNQADLGNLAEPLPLLQAAGLWPVGDFRVDPSPRWAAVVIALACLAAACVAVAAAWRARKLEIPALLAVSVAGAVPAIAIGAPWIDAKAMAILSPFPLLAAAALAFRATTTSGPALAALSALAVSLPLAAAWSTLSVYADVQVVPHERLEEAHELAGRLAGTGPALVLDPDHYATRYLFRKSDAEGASDLRFRPVARYDGGEFPNLTTAEVDEVATADLWVYRLVVRRRSPGTSRPPTAFEPVHAGRAWEAWRRPADAPQPLARLPLGGAVDPTAVPECGWLRSLAATPGAQRLVAAVRTPPVVLPIEPADAPSAWRDGGSVRPTSDGTLLLPVIVPSEGTWRVWVGGGVLGRLDAAVDGRAAGSVSHDLAHGAPWLRFGALPLAPGRHVVEVRHTLQVRPGRGGPPWALGPLALTREEEVELVEVPVDRWRELCDGRRLDWVEALGT